MSRNIFVTGTNTDVGKTVVTRAIVRALVNDNHRVTALKPVESGVPKEAGVCKPSDGLALISASKSTKTVDQTCCYMFSDPVSPHLAARRENETIDKTKLLPFLQSAQADTDVLIVEGAGGLLVPLNDELLYADFIAATGYDLLIVAPDVLGTINTTLLTIEAARKRGIPILGVVLNRGPNPALENAEAIAHYGRVDILGQFPNVTNFDDDALALEASRHLDLKRFVPEASK